MCFHLFLETNDLQDKKYTSIGDDIKVTVINLYLHILKLIPSDETQLVFKKTTQNNYKTSYYEYYPERRPIPGMSIQIDIGSAQEVSFPKYLHCAHQTRHRINIPGKKEILRYLIILIFVIIMLKSIQYYIVAIVYF